MATSWTKFDPDATKAAVKILGPQATIPDMIPALDKAWDAHHGAWKEFGAARQRLKDAVDNLEQMGKGVIAAWEAEKDAINTDVLIAISLFDSADAALASNEKAAAWVRNHVLEFVPRTPEVMVGDVLIAEQSSAPDGAA